MTAAAASPRSPSRPYAVTPPATVCRTPSAANVTASSTNKTTNAAPARIEAGAPRPRRPRALARAARRGRSTLANVERRPALDVETMSVRFVHNLMAVVRLLARRRTIRTRICGARARRGAVDRRDAGAVAACVRGAARRSARVSRLFGRGVGGLEVVLTTFLLNVRHVLYGMSLGRVVPMTQARRLDQRVPPDRRGVQHLSRRCGARSNPFVLGTEVSLFSRLERHDARRCARRRSHTRPEASRRRLRVPRLPS